MKVTRIDVEGCEGRYAQISRRQGSDTIQVRILTPDWPEGLVHRVRARGGEDEVRAAARDLHMTLEGHAGTRGDVQDYYDVLARFTD